MSNIVIYNSDPTGIDRIQAMLISEGFSSGVFFADKLDSLIPILEELKEFQTVLLFITRDLEVNEEILLNYLRSQIKISIIFCGKEEWAYKAWKWRVFDFLRLPVLKKELLSSLNRYKTEKYQTKDRILALKFQGGIYRIQPEHILFIKGEGNYSRIWLKNGQRILVTRKIGELTELLSFCDFIHRIGRSYIINVSMIQHINNSEITFAAVKPIIVKTGPTYTKRIQELIRHE